MSEPLFVARVWAGECDLFLETTDGAGDTPISQRPTVMIPGNQIRDFLAKIASCNPDLLDQTYNEIHA
jgi:hypothetical protein